MGNDKESFPSLDDVTAFQDLARRQGVTAEGEFPPPGRQPPYKIVGIKEVTELILQWDEKKLTAENYAWREPLLTWTMISLAWGGALNQQVELFQIFLFDGDPPLAVRRSDPPPATTQRLPTFIGFWCACARC